MNDSDNSKTAGIYFYEQHFPPVTRRFGVQCVLEGKIIGESNFLWSGDLNLDREKAKDYGRAIGEKLRENGIVSYNLHLNRKYKDETCIRARDSDVWALREQFEEAIKKELNLTAV